MFNVLGEYDGTEVIDITGTDTYPTSGELDMTTVSERGGPYGAYTLPEAFVDVFDEGTRILPEELLFPPDSSDEELKKQSKQQFSSSQSSAVAAALRELDLPVQAYVEVGDVSQGAPAEGKLEVGDVIRRVQGERVREASRIGAIIRPLGPGAEVEFVIRRNAERMRVSVTTQASDRDPKAGAVGISLSQEYRAPFRIKFGLEDVGGPSAGMIFAMGIIDKLTPGDLLEGRRLAGTGTMSPDGQVGPIGGIQQKMVAAKDAGAGLFLIPKDNCEQAVGSIPEGLATARVSTLKQALAAVDDWKAGRALPQCAAG